MIEAKLLFFANSTLLEGPVWDNQNELVYCVSIEQNQVYAIDVNGGRVKSYETKGNVGCVALKGEKLLIAEKFGVFEVDIKSGERRFIAGDYSNTDMRFNDGKLDNDGDFLVGIKGDKKDYDGAGSLFFLEGDKLLPIIKGTTISNGIGFNETGEVMYFIDTPTLEVRAYRYRKAKPAEYLKTIVKITDGGCPDGMCVDIDGNIWVAEWGGSKVCKWDVRTGEKLMQIELPVKNVSSCCIGGKNMDSLFITTAKCEKEELLAGGLFVAKIR